ncbi:two-component sensor histidine kinase [Companilactobacillus crustorum]|uniref:histidine kinase n=3 Tax=Companilactobacillus TaxID=2767879 RepID=A0A837RN09_9LACO|nr:HAMP domain-containing sensor histidine kinase [Companilactobacillus crustorum]KRK44575.1 histidine protein kinase [Companilactobacillus crustorum JCM 15951]KRO21773.1 histidine protein kinase [Companilactobacillus crustorum]GEO77521.1 two-component sensor histidine kinase [Companilactobacillus crustorum]
MIRKQSSSYQELINNAIRKLVIIITLSISALILIVVGVQQYAQTVHEANGQMMSLYRSNIDDIPGFIQWSNQNNRHTKQSTVIRVKTKKSSITATSSRTGQEIMTTSTSKKFINQKKFIILPGQHIVYVKGFGLFLFYTKKDSDTNYQLWTSLNRLINSLILLLIIISIIVFVTLGFGTWWAQQLAAKLSAPTIELVKEIHKTTQDPEVDQPTLQVPSNPQEIKELGQAFNELLKTQNQRLQHEKDFVSNASHELKTPIAAIRGNIKLIKRHGDKHPDVIPESLGFIDEESLRMQNLITNLLHLSRADRAEFVLEKVNLSTISQQIGQQYQKTINHKLKLQITPDLHISGNSDTLKQIIVALLDNANKYSPTDMPITLALEKSADKISLAIKDLGIGIPDDKKQLIFQRFYRVDTSHSTEIKGSGLGLSIVSQLVKLNNGEIEVLDNIPKGTIFKVTFQELSHT